MLEALISRASSPPILGLLLLVLLGGRFYARYRALNGIPGPLLYGFTSWRLAYDAWQGHSVKAINRLHYSYGPVVRIGPNEVCFNSPTALKSIYGAGSPFERTPFYSMFDVYGRPNLFTFLPGKNHRDRKKMLSHIYSNQYVLGPNTIPLVKEKVVDFLDLIKREPQVAAETFTSLHYFSIDTISKFVYGDAPGGTQAMKGSKYSRSLLVDILSPSRRRLSWFAVHLPTYTRWITTRTGLLGRVITRLGLLPSPRPFVYSGIRDHALEVFHDIKQLYAREKNRLSEETVIAKLLRCQVEQNLSDMDIASECADHLLAGIDTTADSLMFLLWALSLPQNSQIQTDLRRELDGLSVDEKGIPEPKALAGLPFLNAVLKESLRLYSPLPAFEPRRCSTDQEIDGFLILAGTIVGMSPYCLHRKTDVYPNPLIYDPWRWLNEDGTPIMESDPKNRLFWAFSSGARMCIGIHLANAEMLTLTAAVYKKYKTSVQHPVTTPGITSRYEIFADETMPKMAEHECWINFEPL